MTSIDSLRHFARHPGELGKHNIGADPLEPIDTSTGSLYLADKDSAVFIVDESLDGRLLLFII